MMQKTQAIDQIRSENAEKWIIFCGLAGKLKGGLCSMCEAGGLGAEAGGKKSELHARGVGSR